MAYVSAKIKVANVLLYSVDIDDDSWQKA